MPPSDLIASSNPKPLHSSTTSGHSVDFITVLPYDVVSYILRRLTTWELGELFRVSKTWRGVIINCSELWTKVALSYQDPIVMREPELLFDLPISSRIQELDLLLETNQESYGTLLAQMAIGKFPRLKRLKMKGYVVKAIDPLLLALNEVADTLEDLVVTTGCPPKPGLFIPLGTVLSTCCKLRSFRYQCVNTKVFDLGTIPKRPHGLTELDVRIVQDPPNLDDMMISLLQSCPRLRRLSMVCADGEKVLRVIDESCKALESLELLNIVSYEATRSSTDQRLVLKDLSVYNALDCTDVIIPYLARSTQTLKSLFLDLRPIAVPTWDPLLTWRLPNLRSLALSFDEIDDNDFIANLINSLPQLEDVTLEECDYIGFMVFDALAGLAKLNTLTIEMALEAEEDSLSDMLLGFSEKGRTGPLKCVKFYDCQEFIDTCDVLLSLAAVESLTEIHIRGCSLITEETMLQFCDKLQNHPSISKIKLAKLQSVTDMTLSSLSAVGNLCELELDSLAHITDAGVSDFKVASSGVNLQIVNCGQLEGSTTRMFHGI